MTMDSSFSRGKLGRKESGFNAQFSTTKAIRCETLAKNPFTRPQLLEKENSMKFIASSSLQKAVQKARSDICCILRQPEAVDSLKKNPRKKTSKNVEHVPSIMEDVVKTKLTFSKQMATNPYPKNLQHDTKPFALQKNIVDLRNVNYEQEIISQINQKHLNENDLKWLGKNYSSSHGQIVFKKMKSNHKVEYSNTTLSDLQISHPDEESQLEINKAALDLVKRVQLHEQQLWKRLAEMSVSSASASTISNELGNKSVDCRSLLSFKFPPIVIVSEKTPDEQPCFAMACSTPSLSIEDKDISVSTDNVLSLFGDEWFDNLLKAELEIS